MTAFDKRLHAVRPDLADARLEGQVEAARFSAAKPMQVTAAVADVLAAPRADAGMSTQFLRGDRVRCFDAEEGFCWVQAERDGYVGYVAADALSATLVAATHRVAVPRTFLYRGPDLRLPRNGALSLGSEVAVAGAAETRGTRYLLLAGGEAVIEKHLAPIDRVEPDYVAVAERLVETPYLWGGASGFGIDCSGVVQLAMRMAGRDVLRDSDMQAATVGSAIEREDLRRGDLVFWKGHVAIMTDPSTMVHANGHTMLVSHEGLDEAIARIGYLYGQPTGFRRP